MYLVTHVKSVKMTILRKMIKCRRMPNSASLFKLKGEKERKKTLLQFSLAVNQREIERDP